MSTSVSKVDDSTWKVKGNLTVHGVTKEVTFNAMHRLGAGANGAAIHGFYTEFSINRMDYNVGPSFDNNALGHEVQLYISLEAK